MSDTPKARLGEPLPGTQLPQSDPAVLGHQRHESSSLTPDPGRCFIFVFVFSNGMFDGGKELLLSIGCCPEGTKSWETALGEADCLGVHIRTHG